MFHNNFALKIKNKIIASLKLKNGWWADVQYVKHMTCQISSFSSSDPGKHAVAEPGEFWNISRGIPYQKSLCSLHNGKDCVADTTLSGGDKTVRHQMATTAFGHTFLPVVPRVLKSKMGARVFSYQAPLLWNQLPPSVREADTVTSFKSRLKTFLFDRAYS